MHDPVRFLSIGCSSFVKHKSLSHSSKTMLTVNCLVSPCSFPESCFCSSIGTNSCWILLVLMIKEVPFILFIISSFA
ncbi:hypothetical protein VIGAN_10207000 [Vigna angularis var. angularis]|uniref:Uncharacterized protein n=1 Tax=Vigna angularis var. angularis TaxID=157739 RepID=A0A0S3T5P9_PHAAN|nr:hypothetical protein VIGAN_10207000 [Vigna angularis var. angularis]